ncbi:MAG: hypothetical protein QE278_05130 [Limnobacter sp.]|nr:hypothetical protein [Limnobacter sp.]
MNTRQFNAKSFIATAAIAFAAAAPTFAFAWGTGEQTEHPVFSTSVSRSAPLNTLAWGLGDQTEFPQFNPVIKSEGEAFSGLVTASDRMQKKAMATALNQKTRMQVLDELKMASDFERAQQNVN